MDKGVMQLGETTKDACSKRKGDREHCGVGGSGVRPYSH